MPDIINARLPNGTPPVLFNNTTDTVIPNAVVDRIPVVLGPEGPRGVGVANVYIEYVSGENHLLMLMTDNSIIDAGIVPTGEAGPPGIGVSNAQILNQNLIFTLTDNTVIDVGDVVGENGVGVQGAYVSQNGDLFIDMSNGLTINAGYVKGLDGTTGTNGVGVQSATVTNGQLYITLTSGNVINAGSVVGPNGTSVTAATVNGSGRLILTLSTGATIDAGSVVGPQGPQGSQGAQGLQGPYGNGIISANAATGWLNVTYSNGSIGNAGYIRGEQGPQGIQGIQGIQGPTGPQGNTGIQGIQGVQGIQGAQGVMGPMGPTYENVVTIPAASSTATLDLGGNFFYNVTLAGATTFTFSNTTSNTRTYSAIVAVRQGGGAFAVNWPAAAKTPQNVTYTQSAANGAIDVYTIFSYDGGATYLLTQIGKNFS